MTWEELENNCKRCQGCGLAATRTNVVFGRGNKDADLLFVGEGPGHNEDVQGKAFVGQAGKLLDLALDAIGFTEKDYYIANVVKCRPPENRNPLPEECAACMPLLRKQYALIKPKIVVCLGSIACANLLSPDAKVTNSRNKWIEKGGTLFTATYHPAALLRDERKKIDMYNDLCEVKRKLDELTSGEK